MLLTKAKEVLRLSSNVTDTEVTDLIKSAILDLRRLGVIVPQEVEPSYTGDVDALLERAILLYCKANYGYNSDSEKFRSAYEHLASALSLCSDYNTEVNDEQVGS